MRHPAGRTRTLDSHASRLRRKLDPEGRRFVHVCWGVGYRLVDPAGEGEGLMSPRERDTRVSLDGISEEQLEAVRGRIQDSLVCRAADLRLLHRSPDPRRAVGEVAALGRLAFWLGHGQVLVPDRAARDLVAGIVAGGPARGAGPSGRPTGRPSPGTRRCAPSSPASPGIREDGGERAAASRRSPGRATAGRASPRTSSPPAGARVAARSRSPPGRASTAPRSACSSGAAGCRDSAPS